MNRAALGLASPTPKRVVSIDIERRAMVAEVWGLFDQNIGIGQILSPSRMVSFAAITEGDRDKPVFYSEYHHGQTKMLNELYAVLNSAECLVTYNGKSFDLKHVNTELMLAGLGRPSSCEHVDLLLYARKTFKFDSNKLDYVTQKMRLGKKLDYGVSHSELVKACEANDAESMALFREYNIQDALLNLDLRQDLMGRGWL